MHGGGGLSPGAMLTRPASSILLLHTLIMDHTSKGPAKSDDYWVQLRVMTRNKKGAGTEADKGRQREGTVQNDLV